MFAINEFARLLPNNLRARRLFSRCFLFVQEGDPFHLHFMVPEGTETSKDEHSEESDGHLDIPSSSFDSASSQNSDHLFTESRGYFSLAPPEFPQLGWRVGRGTKTVPSTRNVDLLLADPHDRAGKRLGSNHFRLSVNSESGFLVLISSAHRRHALEYQVEGEWVKMIPESTKVMFQKSNTIRVGPCEYRLVYTIDDQNRHLFVKQRQDFIDSYLEPKRDIHLFFRHVPGDHRAAFKKYIEFHTKASGAFGWVSQGMDTSTGNLIAIKELRIANKSQRDVTKLESEVGTSLNSTDDIGVLSILDAFCEHGSAMPCSDKERFYMLLPWAVSDLSQFSWTGPVPLETKLILLHGPLQGIKSLHQRGIMHRDIRGANILILSFRPPRAVLCDYGKASRSERSTNTAIGPIHTLAPEVWYTGHGYTRAIDLWAFGYTIAEMVGYTPGHGNPRMNSARYDSLLKYLRNHAEKTPEDRELIDLAIKLLAFDADARYTVDDALEHKCWKPLQQGEQSEYHAKKQKLSTKSNSGVEGAQQSPAKGTMNLNTSGSEEISEEP